MCFIYLCLLSRPLTHTVKSTVSCIKFIAFILCLTLLEGGSLYTCGEGRHGKLCSEQDDKNQTIPVKVAKFKGFTVQKVRICA
jgi:hypothetical protein